MKKEQIIVRALKAKELEVTNPEHMAWLEKIALMKQYDKKVETPIGMFEAYDD